MAKLGEKLLLFALVLSFAAVPLFCSAVDTDDDTETDLSSHKTGSKTDTRSSERSEEAMSHDGFSIAEQKALEATAEKKSFESDVNRLMGLIIHSLYSKKEIFLRELISNASDALDKIRFLSLTNPAMLGDGDQAKLEIRIKVDPDNASLTIWDRGIGMTREDLKNNLATIASSGTKRFIETHQGGDSAGNNLIGQFGVGFYSVFLVAQEVTVITKHNDDKQLVWHSDADHTSDYTISEDPRGNTLGRGTQVILKLKEDALEYAKVEEITNLIKRYSEFINFPIYLWSSKEIEKEVEPEDDEDEEADEKDDDKDKEEGDVTDDDESDEKQKKKEKKAKKVKETIWDWYVVNDSKPIWTRAKDEITQDEYDAFFKSLTLLDDTPMAHTHFKAEGSEVEFTSILYIPKKAPSDLFQKYNTKMDNIKLYVRRVFITDAFDNILPSYLNFVKGMVDSDNLPLNVSREMLQQHKMLKTIKKKLTRSVIDMVKRIANAEDQEQYEKFWEQFGTSIKLGVIEDQANRNKLADLLRFKTSKSEDKFVSLTTYVERMKKNQKSIFLITGESVDQVKKSPYIERLLKLGYEVLYMIDPVDEYLLSNLPEYSAKKLVNVGKENFDLAAETGGEHENLDQEFSELVVWLKVALREQIEKALVSKRLYKSPCTLVTGYFGYTPNMERIMKSQAMTTNDHSKTFLQNSKKNLEINPRHPLIKELNRRVQEDKDDPATKDLALLLYETAAVSAGYSLPDPTVFIDRVHKFMLSSLDLDPEAEVDRDEALEKAAEDDDDEDEDEDEDDEDDEEDEEEEDADAADDDDEDEDDDEDDEDDEDVKDEL